MDKALTPMKVSIPYPLLTHTPSLIREIHVTLFFNLVIPVFVTQSQHSCLRQLFGLQWICSMQYLQASEGFCWNRRLKAWLEKVGKLGAPSPEILIYGGKFSPVLPYMKIWEEVRKIWLTSREINIFQLWSKVLSITSVNKTRQKQDFEEHRVK